MLVGTHDGEGRLACTGHVGTGFSQAELADLQRKLMRLGRLTSPFDVEAPRERARDARWTEPMLVGEVELGQRTSNGRLQHPALCGTRADRYPLRVRSSCDRPSSAERNPADVVAGVPAQFAGGVSLQLPRVRSHGSGQP
ncbi:hypothetical protein ABZX92_37645 [Lentzea sp. NPDC006480]|uniref:ATP dependent DNA ligase n=1 Tax=Lentzea sp. NPDC006480 TaxID=3157176 RepID=UPI0033A4A725